MGKFKKKSGGGVPAISTASLPDIVFMLLFFFMVSTVMRETDMLVKIKLPKATEINKLQRKNLVSYIYVGVPHERYRATSGSEARIQLNDSFKRVEDIPSFVISEREARKEEERPFMTTSIKADSDTKMGIIADIKQELRKSQALKINYSTIKSTSGNF
ncbi:ExbD/TolR family protein [Ichthyobacterium seriolicida]|uniref:Biopolymer transport exbD protein n=1 Tax=Ichthyobacterium seriolicida TaxID=242600 RepID=A0A1J1DWC1_9FLAO|nr:biopolymer transporter ExbD [Ichthyobacterium seriolicida]BAV94161.1 biopolymer transport exbD protein [Ichthyobacterium seriolicida]